MKKTNISKLLLITMGVTINIVLAQIPMQLRLPFFLDVIGTILVAALAGPWIGALTGLFTNIVLGLQDPVWLAYAIVQVAIGLSVGILAKRGLFNSYFGLAFTALMVWLVAQITAIPITIYVFGGTAGSGSSFITAYLIAVGQGLFKAVVTTTLLTESVDKVISVLIAYGMIKSLPRKIVSQYPLGYLYSSPHQD
jgi:energy-coupling factor transport system substrate-specific component